MPPTCTGRGDNGDHCCYIAGQVCRFYDDGCSLFAEWGRLSSNPEWVDAPVGRWFAETYPGFDCGDWPQRIPNVRGGLCCYGNADAAST